ncbi:MAG TPA: prolipoprotein diacylglyceryl transferase [Clostridiaceae bacterium]|nr:prolipoprotein diacylglyceryl transferase [Clostridiaceae bacterium]
MIASLNTITEVDFPGLGIEGIRVNSIAFEIGPFTVYWYGIIIAIGLCACAIMAMKQAKRYSFSSDHVIDYVIFCFPAALVGARLYYVFSEWSYYKEDPIRIVRVHDGGLAVIGGVLAAILVGYIVTKVKKLPINYVFDYLIAYIPLGQAVGRWGNFFNQEAFGTNTKLPWGMISEKTSDYLAYYHPELDPNLPVHPTFLYESIANFTILGLLLVIRKKSKIAFSVTSAYLVLYGIARFFIESLRTDSLYIGDTGLRTSQVASVLMVITGIALICFSKFKGWKSAVYFARQAEASVSNTSNPTTSEEDFSEPQG